MARSRKRCHTARDQLASASLLIDLRRFAAKHADVALSVNLASKDSALIAVVILPDAKGPRAKQTPVQRLKSPLGIRVAANPRTPSFRRAKTMACRGKNRGRASR